MPNYKEIYTYTKINVVSYNMMIIFLKSHRGSGVNQSFLPSAPLAPQLSVTDTNFILKNLVIIKTIKEEKNQIDTPTGCTGDQTFT